MELVNKNPKMYTRNDLPFFLKLKGLNNIGIEIGVNLGEYSELMLKNGEFKKFYAVDSWTKETPDIFFENGSNYVVPNNEEIYNKAKERLNKYSDRVQIIRSNSVDASSLFEDEYFDFIYLDADHSLEGIRDDIKYWYPKLKKGGIFSGHDYMDGKRVWDRKIYSLFGVKTAVDEFVKQEGLELNLIKERGLESWWSWYVYKK